MKLSDGFTTYEVLKEERHSNAGLSGGQLPVTIVRTNRQDVEFGNRAPGAPGQMSAERRLMVGEGRRMGPFERSLCVEVA